MAEEDPGLWNVKSCRMAFSHKKVDPFKILDPQLLESPTDMLDHQNMKWCKPTDCKKT